MTDKQTDELVKKKLVDYLNRMGHLPDKAGRYHCIATDHKDGNPSMTIHKSGAYATCWSHPSPKDSFTIFDAIGVFEGIQSQRAQKKRAYEIYQNEIDEIAAELTAKADTKTSEEAKQPIHASKSKETTRTVPAEPKREDKTAVKALEHKYTRPVKPDIFAPKPKETPPPPPEPIALKSEDKVAVIMPDHKEPPLPESAAPMATETPPPPPEPIALKSEDKVAAKTPDHKELPLPDSAAPKATETPTLASATPKEDQKVAAKTSDHKEIPSPDTVAPKTDTGSEATAPESSDDKTPAAKLPAPPVISKTGSQRTIDNRPPSVDFQEWKKRVSQIYNLKVDNKPETPSRTPQIVNDAEIKQSTPPAEPVKPPAEPVKPPADLVKPPIVPVPVFTPKQIKPTPAEPVKPPIVPVPVVTPKQIKPTPAEPVKPPIVPVPVVTPKQIRPATTASAKAPVEPEKATALPVQILESEPKAEPVSVAAAAPAPVVEPKQGPPPAETVKTPAAPVKVPIEPEKTPAPPVQTPEPEPKAEPVTVAKAAPATVVEPKQGPPPAEPVKTPVEPVKAPIEPEKTPVLPVQEPEPEAKAEPISVANAAPATVVEPQQSQPPVEPAKAPVEPEKTPAPPVQEPEPEPKAEPAPAIESVDTPVPAVEPMPESTIDTYLSRNRMTSLLSDLQSSDHAHNWSTVQSTGLDGLDELLSGGLRPGLYMICSKPGEGKTSFALQIADAIAVLGRDVLWISLDMAREELLAKSLSRMTLLMDSAINKKNALTAQAVLEGLRGRPTKVVLQKALQKYQETMSSFYCQEAMSEPSMTNIEHIISQHMTMTGSKPVVIIDCLQYIRYSDSLTETAGIDRAVRTLMQFSRAHQIPMLALSDNIRDSYNSDVIISLQMEPAAGTLADPHVIELEVLKNRHGAFNIKIPFNFFAAFNCLEEK